MNQRNSLSLRLLLASAVGISLAAFVAASLLFLAFRRHAETLALNELERAFVQLASGIGIDNSAKVVSTADLSDPRFEKVYGGLYWQIDEFGSAPLRSASLFDVDLPNPGPTPSDFEVIQGPSGKPLFALHHPLELTAVDGAVRNLMVTMAVDRGDIDAAEASFKRDLLVGFAVLAAALFSGAALQLFMGLKPLRDLQRAIAKMNASGSSKLEGNFPTEMTPLVNNLNDLLAARELALERARQRASNMAHGIKTPITILLGLSEDMAKAGQPELATTVKDNASLIRDQIDRQLARARMASGYSKTATPLRATLERIVNVLSKSSGSEHLNWQINASPFAAVFVERHDLFELVGNLADNARKWAKSTILISFEDDILRVEDDGPGVPNDKLEEIYKRGLKLDSKRAGHGLGLSIVAELADSYGFEVRYSRSSLGGLCVAIAKAESFARVSAPQN